MGTVATLMVPIDVLVQEDTLRVDTRHDVSVRVTYKPFFLSFVLQSLITQAFVVPEENFEFTSKRICFRVEFS